MSIETARHEVLEALRRYVEGYQESIAEFARWMGIPMTDATALGEIMWAESGGRPLSPSTLAGRLKITTGATNAVINRLEAKSLVARSREHTDRRAVTLRATPSARRSCESLRLWRATSRFCSVTARVFCTPRSWI